MLRDAGLLECVDTERKLWMWTHRGNVLTRRCVERIGGCVSLEVDRKIHDSIAEHMAKHA